jgi:hypothetical protein
MRPAAGHSFGRCGRVPNLGGGDPRSRPEARGDYVFRLLLRSAECPLAIVVSLTALSSFAVLIDRHS